MSTLGRSKDKTWGVALRPGMEMATLRSAWEERRLLNGFNCKLTRWFGESSTSGNCWMVVFSVHIYHVHIQS